LLEMLSFFKSNEMTEFLQVIQPKLLEIHHLLTN
jgi:hypothetical protein